MTETASCDPIINNILFAFFFLVRVMRTYLNRMCILLRQVQRKQFNKYMALIIKTMRMRIALI